LGIPATPSIFSLLSQIGTYQQDSAGIADPGALYVVWSGANDLTDIVAVERKVGISDATSYFSQSVNDLALGLGVLVNSGVRNLLVPNVPNIGITPEILALDEDDPGYAAAATANTIAFNSAVDSVLDDFAGVPGLDIWRYDSFSFLERAVADPTSLGFSNSSDPCLQNFFVAPPPTGAVSVCEKPDDFVFWDVFHPSAASHRIIGESIAAALPAPTSLSLFALGSIALFGYRKVERIRLE
jgi:phospholipase/lecithinase/hemolysin